MAEERYKNMWTFLIDSNYGDTADIDSDMMCTLCTRILINAHTSVCGCSYCLECVKAYLNGERRFCPGNTDDCTTNELDIDRNIYPDHEMNYRISKLNVACRYSCGYRCELKNVENHQRMCPKQPVDCPYFNIGCRETRLASDRINEHLKEENRVHARLLVECIDSLESKITSIKGDTVELRSKMAEMRLAMEIDEARATETNELTNEFKFSIEMVNSMEAKIKKYRLLIFLFLLIICAGVAIYLRSVGDTDQQVMEIQTIIQAYDERTDRIEHISKKIEQESLMEKEEMQRRINDMYEIHTSDLHDMDNLVQDIEMQVKKQSQTEFVWAIERWAERTQSIKDGYACKVLYSEPFYSHKNGYKMRLTVEPGGYGAGLGTHLAVYFYIMPGPFDDILSWPFKRDVTLSIINQNTGIDHVTDTIKFLDCSNTRLNKPIADKDEGLGNDTLIEMKKLSSISGLCKDDKIFIRCIVH